MSNCLCALKEEDLLLVGGEALLDRLEERPRMWHTQDDSHGQIMDSHGQILALAFRQPYKLFPLRSAADRGDTSSSLPRN